jgi:succinate-semialdehyde dehydrogenase/glutarate-semialdehyde dehydrogenase
MSTQRAQLNLKNPSLLKSQAFVNNQWVSAKSGKTFQVTNPANNEIIGEVPEMGTEEEVEEVIAVAKKAFESWKNTPPKVSISSRPGTGGAVVNKRILDCDIAVFS